MEGWDGDTGEEADRIEVGSSPPPPHPQNAWAWLLAKPAALVTRSWKAPLAAGRGGLLQSRRWGLHLKQRRRFGVRG